MDYSLVDANVKKDTVHCCTIDPRLSLRLIHTCHELETN